MSTHALSSVEARWSRVGALLHGTPARAAPDLERLLLDTAAAVRGNARLLPIAVTWLVRYGNFVARHRLKRLAAAELTRDNCAVLGLLIETAVSLGAPGDLRIVLHSCSPAPSPGPLSNVQRGNRALGLVAAETASDISRKWGVWTPDIQLKDDAIRPAEWVLRKNPEYHRRIVRKGDLRCSIIECLAHDAAGRARSESELARLCGATRVAVRRALAALLHEGEVTIVSEQGKRDHAIVLNAA